MVSRGEERWGQMWSTSNVVACRISSKCGQEVGSRQNQANTPTQYSLGGKHMPQKRRNWQFITRRRMMARVWGARELGRARPWNLPTCSCSQSQARPPLQPPYSTTLQFTTTSPVLPYSTMQSCTTLGTLVYYCHICRVNHCNIVQHPQKAAAVYWNVPQPPPP